MEGEMKPEILLWLAGELELSATKFNSGYFLSAQTRPLPNAREMFVFDLESNTPEGAWLREKVVEWLATRGVWIIPDGNADPVTWWGVSTRYSAGHTNFETRAKAIIAAVEWVYDKENNNG